MASVQPAEQFTIWAPDVALAAQTELIDRSRQLWGKGGQSVPNAVAEGEFNDPYNDIQHILTIPEGTNSGHVGKILADMNAACMVDAAQVGEEARAGFDAFGFRQVSKSGRFLVPEDIGALVITDVVSKRIAHISRQAIISAIPPEAPEDAPAPFITVGPKLVLRAIDTRQPKQVEVFHGEPVYPSRIFAWSLLRNAVAIEYAD